MVDIPVELLKLDQHVITTEAFHLQQLITPLRQNFGINHFAYQKLYSGKITAFVTTTPLAAELFIKHKFYQLIFFGEVEQYQSCVMLGDFIEKNHPVIQAERESCQIDHHLCIIEKHSDYVEFFFFAADQANYQINNVYLNHLDVFKKFIIYFKNKATSILSRAEQQRIIFPQDASDKTILVSNQDKLVNLKKSYLSNFNLTEQEKNISMAVAKGYSAKKIAQYLNISARTVETHIAHIKAKLHCHNLKELIALLCTEIGFN